MLHASICTAPNSSHGREQIDYGRGHAENVTHRAPWLELIITCYPCIYLLSAPCRSDAIRINLHRFIRPPVSSHSPPPPQLQYAPMLLVALVALASAQRYEPVATKNPITTPSTTTTTITRKTTATTSPTYATTFKRTAVPVRAIADTSKVKRQFPPNPPPNLSPYVGDAFAGPRPSDLLFQYAHTGPDGSVAYGYVYIDCIES